MANTRVVNGINTVVISGRDYVQVSERIRILHELKKEFDILESEPRQYGDKWVWRVVVKIDGHQYIGNAEVHTNAKPGSADATDCWAVAETSAVGRALAFCGLGTLESLASYDEIFRGQPNVTVVEANGLPLYNRPQIASPSSDSEESTISQKTATRGPGKLPATSGEAVNGKNGQHSPLNTVYLKARDAKLFTTTRGNEQADFLKWVASLFPDRTVSTSQDISLEMIEYLEAHVDKEVKNV